MTDRKDMNKEAAYISMDNLAVGYNGRAIIRDICIDINKGEIVTLIGPNGAGKSTILKSITRQLALIGGKVIFDDKNLHKMSAKEVSSKMAVVLTERLKTELMTCYDIVASGRYPYTGKLGVLTEVDERKVDEAIAAVNASELGPRDFNAISDGQKQRILLARAICQDPEIIVLDEPTSFLDIRYKLELLSILRNMAKKKGITVIMSLHEIDLAEKISDKIICVKGEHIYRYGEPDEIFEEGMIRELYSIDNGFFDPLFGSIELPAPVGQPTHDTDIPAPVGQPTHDTDIPAPVGQPTHDTDIPAPVGQPGGGVKTPSDAQPDDSADSGTDACGAKVLVLSSGGSGIPVYRRLQKENTPFIAGVLAPNDIDYQLARLLAAEVITTPAFEPLSEEAFARTMDVIAQCDRVIDTNFPIGSGNRRIEILLQAADDAGKLERA